MGTCFLDDWIWAQTYDCVVDLFGQKVISEDGKTGPGGSDGRGWKVEGFALRLLPVTFRGQAGTKARRPADGAGEATEPFSVMVEIIAVSLCLLGCNCQR